ncbi:MAG: hypothetical protein WCP69_11720 [Bacteroidota bacterium]
MEHLTSIKLKQIVYFTSIILFLSGCAAPRSITQSGKVTPHKQFRFGSNFSGNISTSVSKTLFDGAQSTASDLINQDTVRLEETVAKLEKVALAYSLDPIGSGYDFYLRYGVLKHFDIGYKFASGVHVFDAMYQFMGSTGTIESVGKKGICGSIGVQYSSQKYDLPLGFNKIQDLLGYTMKRKDILIPLIFSVSFGEEEKFGNFSWGLAYSHSFIDYGFDPDNIFYDRINSTTPVSLTAIEGKKNYSSIGAFVNIKAGYKYVYLISSLSVFYQDYGTYNMLGGGTANLSGLTIIPTLGIQFNLQKLPWFKKKSV